MNIIFPFFFFVAMSYADQPQSYSIADLLRLGDLQYTVQDQEINEERVAVAIDIRDRRVGSLQGLAQIPGIETCTDLSIRFTQIPVVTVHDFKDLNQLKRLSITNNSILHAIQPDSFVSLSQLYYLDLSHNPELLQLREGMFNGLSALQELNISSHHLKVLNTQWFKGLDNLKIIYTKALGNLLIQKIYRDLNNRKMLAKRGFEVRIMRRF